TEDYSGREQYLATTKGDLSHEETRSKIEYHRVQKRRELKNLSAFFVFLRHKGGMYTLEYTGSVELKDKYIKIVWRL
ncbi:MAG: hypothetical protein IIU51_10125, partial [Bacteroidaceae bacterium]|nr:hypothetical protein [Bacteroidaceae bacterium]